MDVPIVEDNEKRTAFFREWIGSRHRLRFERSGTGAIKALHEKTYDLIFLDHDLSSLRTTGYDVARAMQKTPNARTPTIVHSMNISAAQRLPPLLPCCRMLSFAELRKLDARDRLWSELKAFAGPS